MGIIVFAVFTGVFIVAVLLMYALRSNSSMQSKQVLAILDSALSATVMVAGSDSNDFRKDDLLSRVPLLNRFLQKMELAPRLQRLLSQANLKWTVGGMLLVSTTLFVIPGYFTQLRTGSALLGVLVGGILGFIPFAYALRQRSRRFKKFEQVLPDALQMMVSALRVGHSLNAAIGLVTREAAEPLCTEFRVCFEEQNFGVDLRTAMDHLTERVPLQDLKIVATAILIQKESGGNLAEVLENATHAIRERFRLRRQVSTHTAQGRLTGWILTALPIVLGFMLYLINPASMSLLWTREIGIKLLYAASAMIVVGGIIINKIVSMEV